MLEKIKQFFNIEDTEEVKQLKNELRNAYYKSQYPRELGILRYESLLISRPIKMKPFAITFNKMDEREAVEKYLGKEKAYEWDRWDRWEKEMEKARKQMEKESDEQKNAVLEIGKLQKKLIEKIGSVATAKFCRTL
jgi:hypothetical protein